MSSSTRRRSVSPMSRNMAGIKKNSVGGIAVDEQELKAAFEFFDVSGKGKITLNDLKNRLGKYKYRLYTHTQYIHLHIYRYNITLINKYSNQIFIHRRFL